MNKFKKNIFPLTCLFLGLLAPISYYLFFRFEVNIILSNSPSSWSEHVIEWFYPRFYVEKHRFSTSFFLEKTALVFLRASGFFLIMSLISSIIINTPKVSVKWNNFWEQYTNQRNLNWLNRLYILFIIIFTYDLAWDIINLQTAAVFFYQPAFILKLFGLGFPTIITATVLLSVFYTSLILSFFEKYRQWTFLLTILLFIYFESLLNSFQKIDHGFASFIYVGIGLSLSNFINHTSNKIKHKWPILLTQLWICLCYLLSGLEKLTISGFDWLSIQTIKSHLVSHHTILGLFISESPIACHLVLLVTILIQFGFIAILFNKKLIMPILLIGIFFHWGTTLALGINQIINPWIAAYIVFIDWKNISLYKRDKKSSAKIEHT